MDRKVPQLKEFVNQYLPTKLPMNWHHELFYDILENRVIQKADGRLYFNNFVNSKDEPVQGVDGYSFLPFEKARPIKINNNILMLAPRFHAKSQCFTINYPIWEMHRNPNVRIMIVSANDDIAASFNRAIMNNLMNNQKLIDSFGSLAPEFQEKQKWGEKAIIIRRDTMEKDPTVAAIGVGGRLISRRADIIIIDDLIDIETARTATGRRKTREWYENVLLPILEEGGRLILAGTSWYRGDIYDTLWQESEFDIRLKLKALMYSDKYQRDDGKEIRYIPYDLLEWPLAQKVEDVFSDEIIHHYRLHKNLKGGTMWPEKWSYKKLMYKKVTQNMSNSSFMRQYLNEPSSEEEKLFKDSYIKGAMMAGARKTLLPTWDNANPDFSSGYGHMIIGMGIDLAISRKASADNRAIALWGLTEDRRRVPLYLDFGKWSLDETKQKIIELYHAFRPVKVRVETVAFQDMMRQELAEDIPIEGFHTTSSKKFNPETGISHMALLMEQGKMILPTSRENKTYYDRVRQLITEMTVYSYDQHPGDVLMASWFACDILREFDDKLRDNRGYFSSEALVDQLKNVRAASRVLLLTPNYYKIAGTSLVYVFRPVVDGEMFIRPDEKFFIFSVRGERSCAYVFEKSTNEIVAKMEGDISVLMYASLLEKASAFFNKAQVILDREGEGEGVYMELERRGTVNLLCMQPDDRGLPIYREGFRITEGNLPLAVSSFKVNFDRGNVRVPDDQLIKEMGDMISVNGNKLNLSFGEGLRIKAVSIGLWLLENYETDAKVLEGEKKKRKISKTLKMPYATFR